MSEASESNPQKRLRAEKFFQTGNEAAQKNILPYAIEMYRNALREEPGNMPYRLALRQVERRKFDNNPAKVGKLVGARNQPIRLRANGAKNKGKFAEALEHCEDAFVHNPWDVAAAIIGAEAAEGLELPVLARWLLESVAAQAGDDAHFFRHLAHAYELNEDWGRAIACWEKVRKLVPSDEEAGRKIRGLEASATITRSGLDQAIKRSAQPEAIDEVAADGEELKQQALTPEERLRKQIEAEPWRVGPYLELAELLRRAHKLDEAEQVLARGVKRNPDEDLLVEAHADTQIARLQRAQAAWTRKVQEAPHDEARQAKLDRITAVLNDYEAKEFRRRADRHPEDLALRHQLGLRLARIGRHDEAIGEFQKARTDPALRVEALYQVGLCFEAKGLPKLAERNYQEALKLVDPADQALINGLHYRLGRAAEAHGDLGTAEDHYNEVAANDYTFEDVARRLESLNRRAGS